MAENSGKSRMTTERRQKALALVGGESVNADAFLPRAAEALAAFLGCRWAGIGKLSDNGDQIQIVTIFDAHGQIEPFAYPLHDSPCGQIYAANPLTPFRYFPEGVSKLFSGPPFLKQLGVEGYIGEAIYDADGVIFGHTFAISTDPIDDDPENEQFFRLVSHWIATVLVQRRDREALAESEDRFRKVIDEVADAIMLHDMDGRFVDVNEQAVRALGYSRDELLSKHVWDIETGVTRDQVVNAWRAASPGEQLTFDGRHRRKDGSEFPVDVRGRLILVGEIPMIVVSARDITEIKNVETALIEARRTAEEASRAKSNFVANISHELRTPLNAIIGFTDVMQEGVFGKVEHPRYQEYISDVNRSGRHLLDVISDVLDLSKIEAGKETLEETILDPLDLVTECKNLIPARAREKGVDLYVSCEPAGIQIRADAVKLRQILLNLISNAVKFSPSGTPVTVSITVDENGGVSFVVMDQGPGIALENIELAFEAFRQLEPNRKSVEEGTGLGLPIARSLAELHGGSLRLESEVGRGTRAILTLPPERFVQPN